MAVGRSRRRSRGASRHADRGGRRATLTAIAISATAILFAVVLLAKESVVSAAQDEMTRATEPGGPAPRGPFDDRISIRADVASALALARYAATETDPARRRDALARARNLLSIALPIRTHWGEAQVTSTYVAALTDGDRAPSTLGSFAASYADAPFLRHAAAWRVQYGFTHWDLLGSVTQGHVAEEAAWLAMLDGKALPEIFALARATPAYEEFLRHWRIARRFDV